jgi:hypothetical protein
MSQEDVREYMGPAEIRRALGIRSTRTLHLWRQRPDFPEPLATLEIGPVWDGAQIRQWHANRKPGGRT